MTSSFKPPEGFPDTPIPEKKLTFEEAITTGTPKPSPPPSGSHAPTRQPKMTTRERSTPKIQPKLVRQHNYAEWILYITQTLVLFDYENKSIWQIVTGEVTESTGSSTGKAHAKKLR